MSFFAGKRVVITGGAAFIGSNLAISLAPEAAELVIVDCFREGCGGNLFNLSPIDGQYELHRIDIGDTPAMSALLVGADVVFDLAGRVSHKRSMTHPQDDFYDNAVAHLGLLEAARVSCPKARVVFAGTRGQYGKTEPGAVTESHPQEPQDVNGVSKLAAEALMMLYHRTYDLGTTAVRLSNSFGPGQALQTHELGVLNWFIRQLVDGDRIQLYGGGQQIRDIHHVDDVVSALCSLASTPSTAGEVYNLGGLPISLRDFVATAMRLAGTGEALPAEMPRAQAQVEIGDYVADTTKIRSHTGWAPTRTEALDSAIADTLAFYRAHKAHYWGA